MTESAADAGRTMNIADRISSVMIERREVLGLSLQTVADRAGLTKSHIWDLEAGNARNPTLNAMVGISRALGVSLDYLTGLSNTVPDLHPEALRIALEVDAALRAAAKGSASSRTTGEA